MDKPFIPPKIPLIATFVLLALGITEIVMYGLIVGVPLVWVTITLGIFYISYQALFRRDVLPLIFSLLFFTAHHGLYLNSNHNLPIAPLFLLIFLVNSVIMWFLLHYTTHLKLNHHLAYSLISGLMMAQIITLFATMARDWSFRFELASYMPTVFSYIFWRFACLASDSMLGWKQFTRVALVVVILILVMILGSPNVPV